MTQADIPHWCHTFQLKLMAALDAAWAILEHSHDPAEIRRARDKAKAVGDLAAMARKVALMIPTPRGKLKLAEAIAGMATTQAVATVQEMVAAMTPAPAPVAAQAEPARRALDKLKGGRRGRL